MKSLSASAKTAWQIAAYEASYGKSQYIEKEHVLLGILSFEKILDYDASDIDERFPVDEINLEAEPIENTFKDYQLEITPIRRQLRSFCKKGNFNHTERFVHRSDNCKEIFQKADLLSVESPEITSLHLFAAILDAPGDTINLLLSANKVDIAKLRETLLHKAEALHTNKTKIADTKKPKSKSLLERFGRDLNAEARAGKLGPFIGRQNELLQVVQTLVRSKKNNPILVGEPGVGKTAIVEALAVLIQENKAPKFFENKRIIELNLSNVVGGTKYRGEFEERLNGILKEIEQDNNIILFIDEIHNLVDSGSGGGSMDGADIMKPALSRGTFGCIGATTTKEYRRYIEKDSALERRFEKIIIEEPTRASTLEILMGVKQKLEQHHNIVIPDDILDPIVELSIKFDPDHYLPDKAIGLLDKAAAKTQIPQLNFIQQTDENEIQPTGSLELNLDTVIEILAAKTSIPKEIISGHLSGGLLERIKNLEEKLNKRVIGQPQAIDTICDRLTMSLTGIKKRRGPIGVFLFLGPSGVGKTELAKALAAELFWKKEQLIRLDMSEFMEKHSVSKLIGSPPGYIGYEEEGQFTSKLISNPYSLVLLDEVEKAHPRVFDLFLQVFDEGTLTDAKGKKADAKNAIFVMTSNINVDSQNQIGFAANNEKNNTSDLNDALKQFFRTEFLNRIDEKIIFNHLGLDASKKILTIILDEIVENLKTKHSITLTISKEVESLLIKKGVSIEYGARNLNRTVEQYLQVPLGEFMLENKKRPNTWIIDIQDNNIVVTEEEIQTS